MQRFFMALWWSAAVLPCGAQTVPIPVEVVRAPQAWLGLKVAKPDPSISTHLPTLPPGIGFVVKTVDTGGPAETAGIRELDLIWKLGDQMLVNEAQLAALLRLSKPGEEVTLAAFRRGEAIQLKVKLGQSPSPVAASSQNLADAAILPVETSPMRVINLASKSASYSNEEGKAMVRKEGDVYRVSIRSNADELIYEGELSPGKDFGEVPQAWRNRICALRRGLDHALENRKPLIRQPRPRVVPVPPANGAKS